MLDEAGNAPAPPASSPRLAMRFATGAEGGGGGGANREAAAVLRAAYPIVEVREADLQVCSFDWNAPLQPPRLFLDHGSFADASFWTYTAPGLRGADTIVVTSRVCEQVAARLVMPGCLHLARVPLPVDLQLFRPRPDRAALRAALAKDFRVPVDGPLLLVVAGFVRRKNHHHAIDLFTEIRRRHPDARLALAGGTPHLDRNRRYRLDVERQAVEAGLEGAVHFLGPVERGSLTRLLAAADLLLHLTTCRLENFGLAAAEAGASGLPVLAADWGGLRDLITDGENGWLAPTWLSDGGPRIAWRSLVSRACALLEDRRAWQEMSLRARRRAEAAFAPSRHAGLLRQAVVAAAARARESSGAIEPTPEGRELGFRTLTLHARHRDISGTGEEFRRLMPLDGGRHYRLLAGPAATFERSPLLSETSRPSPLISWKAVPDGIEVTDPAWPGRILAAIPTLRLLSRCDGTASLRQIVEAVSRETGASIELLFGEAQGLADAGVLSS
jgi:glycosyltransferase involved in cell wall biosynthesis